jgi:hypothetical protein
MQLTEIRRIMVRGQTVQNESDTLSQKYPTQKDMLAEWFKW